MRTLTEQITFKVSHETLLTLRERGRSHRLDANPYARKLVEEGLERDRAESIADELHEVLGLLRPLAEAIAGQPALGARVAAQQAVDDNSTLLTQSTASTLAQLDATISKLHTQVAEKLSAVDLLVGQLRELRSDLNKTFAALLHYQMGFSAADAQRWIDARLSV